MKTVKAKLFLFFMICITAFAAINMMLNSVFLEDYYIYKSRAIFNDAFLRIQTEYESAPGGIEAFIRKIDRTANLNCIIAGSDLAVRFSSFPQNTGENGPRLSSEIVQLIRDSKDKPDKSYAYGIVTTPDYGSRDIAYVKRMSNGDLLILKKPLDSVILSSAIANEFLLYIGLCILLVGSVIIYLFSRRITKPVTQMDSVAKSIAKLDFSLRTEVNSSDEIGTLAKSINSIADKLSSSIEGLKLDIDRRKQLIRNLSHELKTPIGVIKGYAEGLKFGVADNRQKVDEYCGVIVSECDRMNNMVSQMLELSRLDSGVFVLSRSSFSLCELANAVVKRFVPELKEKGIEAQIICEGETTVFADRDLVDRVFDNYLSNAVKHTGIGGRIVLTVRQTAQSIKLNVFNTGNPVEDTQRIWDVFYREDRARERQAGHGLGLSIVASIAALHGAQCGCVNDHDGVSFYFDFQNNSVFSRKPHIEAAV